MNRYARLTILFLGILLAIVYTIQFSLSWCYRNRVSQKFTKIFRHEIDPQIMMFGSSVMYHQFNPNTIKTVAGRTAYNMGWDGVFFVQYNSLIKEYLSYEKHCTYIVIGCDFDNLGKNELVTRSDLFLAYLDNNFVYESLHDIEPEKMFRAKYLPGYKLTILNKSFYKDILMPGKDSDTLKGYDPSDVLWDKIGVDTPYNARYDDHIFTELQSTINEINGKGIKVILVMTPVYKEGYKLIQNAADIKSKYKSLANKNVFFIDYTTDTICNTKTYFHNYSHLNKDGAERFSGIFAKDLLNIIHE